VTNNSLWRAFLLESSTTEDEKESWDALEAQVLSLSQVVRDNIAEFVKHVHGSHVVRTLLHVLAGCMGPPRTEPRPGTLHNSGHSCYDYWLSCLYLRENHAGKCREWLR